MNALILVDLQNDFFPGGSLEVKHGDMVLPAVNKLISMPFDLVIASQDYHPRNHVSFAKTHGKEVGDIIKIDNIEQILWPVHCVINTEGVQLAPGWDLSKVDFMILKGTDPLIDSYSTFFDNGFKKSTGLEKILREKKIHTLYIAGLATDYCVKYSVMDALSLGFKVKVVKEACKAVNLHPNDEKKAYKEMEEAGAEIVSVDDIKIG